MTARAMLGRPVAWWMAAVLALVVVVLFRPVAQLLEPSPPGVKVILWHSQRGEERDTLETLLRQFNRMPENVGRVYVEPLGVPDAAFKDKLIRSVPRGAGPDLLIRPHNELGELVRERVVSPIRASDLPWTEDDLIPKLMDGLSVGGQLFGFPLTYKGLFLFYNRELCPDGPPRDTEELRAMRDRMPLGTFPLAYDATTTFFYHAPFFLAAAGRVFGPDGSTYAVFDEPGVESFRWPGEWKRAGILPPEPNYNEMVRLFQNGQAASIICGPWYRPGGPIAEHAPGTPAKWGVAPMFRVRGRPTGSFVTLEGIFVSTRAKHRAEALQVAAFVSGPVGEKARFERLGLPPVARDSYAHLPEAGGSEMQERAEIVRVQREALEHGEVTPNSHRMAAVWTPALDLLRASSAGRDFDKAVEDARYQLAQIDRPQPPPADWRPYGAVLSALLVLGTFQLVQQVRRGARGPEAVRAQLTGFHARAALPFLLPGVLAVGALVFAPLLVGAAMSLTVHELGSFTFCGLENFRRILFPPLERALESRSFYYALGVTVLWTLTNVTLHVGIGIGLAMLLRPTWNRLRTVYRVLLILPWAIPNYITALMWKGMFNAQVGAINVLLGPFGFEGFNWFDRFTTAFAANLVTNTWLGFPFMMVVTLGALQSIPAELEEAAVLDGATRLQRFRWVIFPHLRPALVPAIILGSVWTFNMFNIIYLVSGGDPNSQTDILISEAYRWAFERGQRFGYAAAYSVLIFAFLLVYSRWTSKLQEAS